MLKQPTINSDSSGNIILPKTNTASIKRGDGITSGNGWIDITGQIIPKATGGTAPVYSTFRGNQGAYAFANTQFADIEFHVPHDYLVGSPIYLHPHWGHNATNISGNMVFTYYISHGKRTLNNPCVAWDTEVTLVQTIITFIDITNMPRYTHRVDDIAITSATGSASTLDVRNIATDSIIFVRCVATTVPTTLTGASPASSIYIFTIDLHCQSTGINTPNKDPDFYA